MLVCLQNNLTYSDSYLFDMVSSSCHSHAELALHTHVRLFVFVLMVTTAPHLPSRQD